MEDGYVTFCLEKTINLDKKPQERSESAQADKKKWEFAKKCAIFLLRVFGAALTLCAMVAFTPVAIVLAICAVVFVLATPFIRIFLFFKYGVTFLGVIILIHNIWLLLTTGGELKEILLAVACLIVFSVLYFLVQAILEYAPALVFGLIGFVYVLLFSIFKLIVGLSTWEDLADGDTKDFLLTPIEKMRNQ